MSGDQPDRRRPGAVRLIHIDQKPVWQCGYAAGLAGEPSACPPEILDQLAWQSGYIEGRATRKG